MGGAGGAGNKDAILAVKGVISIQLSLKGVRVRLWVQWRGWLILSEDF